MTDPDQESVEAIADAAHIKALTARAERAETLLGERRMCLNCGRTAPASHDRAEPGPGCVSPDACTFDLTPDEAWHYWRKVAHDLRDRAKAAEAALARVDTETLERAAKVAENCFLIVAPETVSQRVGTESNRAAIAAAIRALKPQRPAPADQDGKGGGTD